MNEGTQKTDEKLRPRKQENNCQETDFLHGINGTFRKLEID